MSTKNTNHKSGGPTNPSQSSPVVAEGDKNDGSKASAAAVLSQIKSDSRLKKLAFDLFAIMVGIRLLVVFFITPYSMKIWKRKGPWDVRYNCRNLNPNNRTIGTL